MSLRSMSLSKVDSMVALSVLLSTTRKFFCESGAAVTCCLDIRYDVLPCHPRNLHQCRRGADRLLSPRSRSAEEARRASDPERSYLVTDHGKKLPVPVVCL